MPVTSGMRKGSSSAMPRLVTTQLDMTKSLRPPSSPVTTPAAMAVGAMPVKNAISAAMRQPEKKNTAQPPAPSSTLTRKITACSRRRGRRAGRNLSREKNIIRTIR